MLCEGGLGCTVRLKFFIDGSETLIRCTSRCMVYKIHPPYSSERKSQDILANFFESKA